MQISAVFDFLTIWGQAHALHNREVIVHPNNLVFGRPSLINHRGRLQGVGKLPPLKSAEEEKA